MTNSKAVNFWLNGQPVAAVPACDRGLHYGDGFFTTALVVQGQLLNASAHWHRLQESARRLNFVQFDLMALQRQLRQVLAQTQPDLAVIKILVTRGCGGQGYAPLASAQLHYIIQQSPYPLSSVQDDLKGAEEQTIFQMLAQTAPIQAKVLQTQWGLCSRLAGLKHLNRLENVLARQELQQSITGLGILAIAEDSGDKIANASTQKVEKNWAEGVMLDEAGWVISGTQANLVAYIDGQWVTPKLHHCGVMGTTLARLAETLNITAVSLSLLDLSKAEALFFCNAIRGVQPVATLYFDEHLQNVLAETVQAVNKPAKVFAEALPSFQHYSVARVQSIQQLWAAALQQDLTGG